MDNIRIGQFISELRREKHFTQEQLGEKLGVTNKTISRWETGAYLPPAEALMAMSRLFSVSVNEILSGRRLTNEEYRQEAEKNICEAVKKSSFGLKEKMDFFKKKWLKEHIALMVIMGIIVIGIFIFGLIAGEALAYIASILLAAVFYAYANNSMMSYAENHSFDGNNGN